LFAIVLFITSDFDIRSTFLFENKSNRKQKPNMVAIKVKMRYAEGGEDLHYVIKFKVPKKWKPQATIKLKETFVENYNAKHGDKRKLEVNEIHLVTSTGKMLYDEDIIENTLSTHEDLQVKPGAPPKKKITHWSHPNVAGANRASSENNVGGSTLTFNYSKWDNLDVSDEEEDGKDCHPNIDKKSWVRLKQQKREEERRQQREKLEKLTKERDEKKERLDRMKKSLPEKEPEEADKKELYYELRQEIQDLQFNLDDAEHNLAEALRKKKWTADELCQVGEDVTSSNPNKNSSAKLTTTGGTTKSREGDAKLPGPAPLPYADYDEYVTANAGIIRAYAKFTGKYDKYRDFLMSNLALLHEHTIGYLLLLCLDHEMNGKREEARLVAHNYQMVQFILELATANNWDPRDALHGFFKRIYDDPNHETYLKGFNMAVDDFMKKLIERAIQKKKAGEASPLAEEEKAKALRQEQLEELEKEGADKTVIADDAPLGPGGLSPQEVFDSLPEKMQECFASQDIPMLQKVIDEMPQNEAAYHMKRCVDSGLWVP
jgi:cell division cycle protein 37